jgi:hypothetical protein
MGLKRGEDEEKMGAFVELVAWRAKQQKAKGFVACGRWASGVKRVGSRLNYGN